MNANTVAGWIGGAVLIFVLILAGSSATYVVEPGHRGVQVTLGRVAPDFKPEGFGFKLPFITRVESVAIRQQTTKTEADCYSSDLQQVKINVRVLYRVPPASVKIHDQFRGTRKTKDGHYFVCRKGEHLVEELDAEGKSLREIPVPGDVHECLPLPDGHLLIACGEGHKIEERDATGKIVWELNENDLPGNPLRLMTGFQRLPNGNTIFCNYLGHGHLGRQPHFFEITPAKKIVWEFADHAHFKTVNQLQVLDVAGDPAKGEILR